MKKIVYIGGGGGVSNVVPTLRDHFDVTAILTTFDDGGSYGRLRFDYKTPLTGDVRRALAALSTNRLGGLTEYRFPDGDVKGHTVGNLLLTSVMDSSRDAEHAMDRLHELFEVRGRVLPVSHDLCELIAELKDRTIIKGEHKIDEPHAKSHIGVNRVWLDPEPTVAPGVLSAIASADIVIMGPGDIYTSIVPSLLVPGVKEALLASCAKKLYFSNMFTKFGQTNRYTAFDHIRSIEAYLEPKWFDTVVLNTSQPHPDVIEDHHSQEEQLVLHDEDLLIEHGYTVLKKALLEDVVLEKSKADVLKRSKIRYAEDKVLTLVKSL